MTKKEHAHKYYTDNKEEIRRKQKLYYQERPPELVDKQREDANLRQRSAHYREQSRERRLSKLGWTQELYDEKFVEQQGTCAICKQPAIGRPLDADHRHSTPPKPRGLLCNKHNQMLGLSGDNIELLEAAIEYLKKYQTQNSA